MKRKGLFVLVAVCLIALVGCVPSEPTTTPLSPTDVEQNARLDQLQQQVSNVQEGKANASTVTALQGRVTTLEGQSSANTYTKGQLYTQEQVDAQIAAAVKKLKDDQAWITGTGDTSGTVTGDYGGLVDSDLDLELWVERTDPASDPMRFNDGKDSAEFEIVVVNTEDTYHDFRLYLRMTPEDSVNCASDNETKIASYPSTGAWTVTRDDWDTSNRGAIYFSMDSDDTIGKLKAEDYLLSVTIDSVYGTYWNYRLTIEQMD